ncbi:hypothetical protein DPMN_001819 [Dreissena polymorpha]|uniref:Uncharacterized protein n=1 Tax=Dreissena polymorpha TaxID=45954 RepID=A0A9D4ML16_DREPO|nr:hypothetical protein DPMN_001819 [Dreissena polymorpha]
MACEYPCVYCARNVGEEDRPTHAMNVKDGSICRVRLGSVRPRVLRASCCAVRQKQWI